MTNYEKIKNKTVKEMAEFIDDITYDACKMCRIANCDWNADCKEGVQKWLESEAEE